MHYRKLGNSGAVVAHLCLGTMTFGNESTEEDFVRPDGRLCRRGRQFPRHRRCLYGRGVRRDRRPLAQGPSDRSQTDGHRHQGALPDGQWAQRSRALAAAISATRSTLRSSASAIERIDLYQMHAWDALTPIEETLRFLDDAVSAGKIAYYGFSNYLGWHITKAVYVARANAISRRR